MKKLLSLLSLLILMPFLTACEVSNTDLANSLEGNMTRLVYSVGYLDSISTEELSNLVNNSSYFTHSSLYTNSTNTASTETEEIINNTEGTLTSSTIENISNTNNVALNTNPHRTRTYNSPLLTNSNINSGNELTSNVGVVDMSLLETSSSDLNKILLEISSKRGIIMLYCTDLRSGKATISANDKKALHEYDDIIQETTNYLNNTTGALLNQFNGVSSISTTENSAELINAKLIRANEVLKTRYAKLDTCLDALDAIINILVNNIGFEYASMYNNQLSNNLTPNTNSSTTAPSTLLNDSNISNTTTNNSIDNTLNSSNSTSSSYCPICNSNNCTCNNATLCPNCNSNNCTCNCKQSANNFTNNTNDNLSNNTADNTSVNYNYEDENSSNIITPNASTYPINRPKAEINLEETATANKLSETEIALNGGLIKNSNTDKINSQNAENFIASPTTGALSKNYNVDSKSYTHPFKTLEETNHNFPITNNLRDDEYIESEKELTPEILPFSGVDDASKNVPQTITNSKLGAINFLPFQYEEDNVLKKIPKQ